jgi:dihydroxyacetone kinase
MQKLINAPSRFVDETLEGILAAHPDRLRLAGDLGALVRADGLPERSAGHEDAGARAVAIALSCAADAMESGASSTRMKGQ